LNSSPRSVLRSSEWESWQEEAVSASLIMMWRLNGRFASSTTSRRHIKRNFRAIQYGVNHNENWHWYVMGGVV
jgi:hypothetical protein